MKNLIIIIAVLVVAFFVWKFIPRGETPALAPTIQTEEVIDQETDTSAMETELQVTYNGTTFSPASITIKQGQSVTFINEANGPMSVASDVHPEHTIYPEFDQYKTSAQGKKTFVFVFDKVGTWKYHNHLNADALGTVVVTAQ